MKKLQIFHIILILIIKISNQIYDSNQPYNFTQQPEDIINSREKMRLTKNVNPTFYDYDIIYKELGHYLLNVSVHPMQYTYMKYPLIVESFNEIPSYMIFRFLYHDKLFDEITINFGRKDDLIMNDYSYNFLNDILKENGVYSLKGVFECFNPNDIVNLREYGFNIDSKVNQIKFGNENPFEAKFDGFSLKFNLGDLSSINQCNTIVNTNSPIPKYLIVKIFDTPYQIKLGYYQYKINYKKDGSSEIYTYDNRLIFIKNTKLTYFSMNNLLDSQYTPIEEIKCSSTLNKVTFTFGEAALLFYNSPYKSLVERFKWKLHFPDYYPDNKFKQRSFFYKFWGNNEEFYTKVYFGSLNNNFDKQVEENINYKIDVNSITFWSNNTDKNNIIYSISFDGFVAPSIPKLNKNIWIELLDDENNILMKTKTDYYENQNVKNELLEYDNFMNCIPSDLDIIEIKSTGSRIILGSLGVLYINFNAKGYLNKNMNLIIDFPKEFSISNDLKIINPIGVDTKIIKYENEPNRVNLTEFFLYDLLSHDNQFIIYNIIFPVTSKTSEFNFLIYNKVEIINGINSHYEIIPVYYGKYLYELNLEEITPLFDLTNLRAGEDTEVFFNFIYYNDKVIENEKLSWKITFDENSITFNSTYKIGTIWNCVSSFPKYKCVYNEKGILNIYNLYEKDEIIDGNFIYNLTIPGWITFEYSKQCNFSLNQIYNFNEIISENLDYQRMKPTLNPTQKIRKINYEHGNGINDNLDSIIFEFIFFNYEKINETLQFDFSKCDIEINNIHSIIVYDQNGNEVDNFEFIVEDNIINVTKYDFNFDVATYEESTFKIKINGIKNIRSFKKSKVNIKFIGYGIENYWKKNIKMRYNAYRILNNVTIDIENKIRKKITNVSIKPLSYNSGLICKYILEFTTPTKLFIDEIVSIKTSWKSNFVDNIIISKINKEYEIGDNVEVIFDEVINPFNLNNEFIKEIIIYTKDNNDISEYIEDIPIIMINPSIYNNLEIESETKNDDSLFDLLINLSPKFDIENEDKFLLEFNEEIFNNGNNDYNCLIEILNGISESSICKPNYNKLSIENIYSSYSNNDLISFKLNDLPLKRNTNEMSQLISIKLSTINKDNKIKEEQKLIEKINFKCDISCNTCNDKNECLTCSKDYPYFNNENRKCIKECKKGYFANKFNNNYCEKCNDECESCINYKNECLICSDKNKYIQDGKCVTKCEKGFEFDSKQNKCIYIGLTNSDDNNKNEEKNNDNNYNQNENNEINNINKKVFRGNLFYKSNFYLPDDYFIIPILSMIAIIFFTIEIFSFKEKINNNSIILGILSLLFKTNLLLLYFYSFISGEKVYFIGYSIILVIQNLLNCFYIVKYVFPLNDFSRFEFITSSIPIILIDYKGIKFFIYLLSLLYKKDYKEKDKEKELLLSPFKIINNIDIIFQIGNLLFSLYCILEIKLYFQLWYLSLYNITLIIMIRFYLEREYLIGISNEKKIDKQKKEKNNINAKYKESISFDNKDLNAPKASDNLDTAIKSNTKRLICSSFSDRKVYEKRRVISNFDSNNILDKNNNINHMLVIQNKNYTSRLNSEGNQLKSNEFAPIEIKSGFSKNNLNNLSNSIESIDENEN